MEIRPLDGAFGAEVHGLDLRSDVPEATLRELADTLYAHRVLVIRDQRLDETSYLEFGRRWGTPIPHALDHLRLRGFPELMAVGNTEKKDESAAVRNGAALWHTDQSYEKVPANATMLYSLKTPATGGETEYCDMALAYERLDDSTKAKLRGLRVAHKYGRGRLRSDEMVASPIANEEQDARVPVIYHPLVMTHPVTGTPALYALGHGAHGIEGWGDEQADALIESLKTHVLQDAHIYRHRYEVGDLVIWDTLQTMHRATPIDVVTSDATARLLWRISVRGVPAVFGRGAASPATADGSRGTARQP